MDQNIEIILQLLAGGMTIGLLAGVISGATTWTIMKTPEAFFRGIFGLVLGALFMGFWKGSAIVQLYTQVMNSAGRAMPPSMVMSVINMVIDILVGGLIGAVVLLGIFSPSTVILGGLVGGLAGTLIGVAMQVIITYAAIPINPLFYSPIVGLLVLVGFALFGSRR